ncbi:protein of unknown function [Rhodovastum atsumiense]|nr:protein of unknown function [Rhodovastum atsumiense]
MPDLRRAYHPPDRPQPQPPCAADDGRHLRAGGRYRRGHAQPCRRGGRAGDPGRAGGDGRRPGQGARPRRGLFLRKPHPASVPQHRHRDLCRGGGGHAPEPVAPAVPTGAGLETIVILLAGFHPAPDQGSALDLPRASPLEPMNFLGSASALALHRAPRVEGGAGRAGRRPAGWDCPAGAFAVVPGATGRLDGLAPGGVDGRVQPRTSAQISPSSGCSGAGAGAGGGGFVSCAWAVATEQARKTPMEAVNRKDRAIIAYVTESMREIGCGCRTGA